MKNLSLAVLAAFVVSLSSCQIIGDIFKAGVGVGVFLVIAVILLVIFIIGKVFSGGR